MISGKKLYYMAREISEMMIYRIKAYGDQKIFLDVLYGFFERIYANVFAKNRKFLRFFLKLIRVFKIFDNIFNNKLKLLT